MSEPQPGPNEDDRTPPHQHPHYRRVEVDACPDGVRVSFPIVEPQSTRSTGPDAAAPPAEREALEAPLRRRRIAWALATMAFVLTAVVLALFAVVNVSPNPLTDATTRATLVITLGMAVVLWGTALVVADIVRTRRHRRRG